MEGPAVSVPRVATPLLFLLLLPNPSSEAALVGTHSLCYEFTISLKPTSGQQWCTVRAQVDQKDFLSYDCGLGQVKSLSALGAKVNGTITWELQNSALRDAGELLKQKLADLKAEDHTARGLSSLRGRMSCQRHPSGHSSASWQFDFRRQMRLHFDSDSRRWTEVHPGSSWMREKWESDREVSNFLHKSSMGDCRKWLEKFLVQWEEELEAAALSGTTPDTAPQKSSAITPRPCALLLILVFIILLVLLEMLLRSL